MNLTLTACVVLCVALTSCRSNKPATVIVKNDSPAPATIVIREVHSHSSDCGHYTRDGRWYSDAACTHVIE
jgi:hypothetical protein